MHNDRTLNHPHYSHESADGAADSSLLTDLVNLTQGAHLNCFSLHEVLAILQATLQPSPLQFLFHRVNNLASVMYVVTACSVLMADALRAHKSQI